MCGLGAIAVITGWVGSGSASRTGGGRDWARPSAMRTVVRCSARSPRPESSGRAAALARACLRLRSSRTAPSAWRYMELAWARHFQHHGERDFGVSREQDGVAGEFHAGDEGGGEFDLGAALGLEVGDAGDEGVVATGLGRRQRWIGRRGEDADGVADDVVVGVGGEGVGEVVRGWHGWGL